MIGCFAELVYVTLSVVEGPDNCGSTTLTVTQKIKTN